MDRITFRTKVDWWLGAMILTSAAVSAIAVVIVGVVESPFLALSFSPILLLGGGLPVWVLLATNYTFNAADLDVRCGPFAWRVPLRDIHGVTATRNPLSSPALSLDRLRIDFGHMRSIMISPEDKEGFMKELRKRVPAV
jgi:hypothetical protein